MCRNWASEPPALVGAVAIGMGSGVEVLEILRLETVAALSIPPPCESQALDRTGYSASSRRSCFLDRPATVAVIIRSQSPRAVDQTSTE